MLAPVVNWFQIVFLRENSQGTKTIYKSIISCELISNCIFTWEFTSSCVASCFFNKLWIDFKLYFYVRIHKLFLKRQQPSLVVNWFQIVFLRENSQVYMIIYQIPMRCELISNCIFTWEFTRSLKILLCRSMLWIDFKLYFYVRIHKKLNFRLFINFVVNWFQIVFLRENSQAKEARLVIDTSCELISNCIFTWEFTRSIPKCWVKSILWDSFFGIKKRVL